MAHRRRDVAVEQRGDVAPQLLQRRDLLVELGEPRGEEPVGMPARAQTSVTHVEQLPDVVEREAELLCAPDEPQPVDVARAVAPVAVGVALGLRQQTDAFVVAHRVRRHAPTFGQA